MSRWSKIECKLKVRVFLVEYSKLETFLMIGNIYDNIFGIKILEIV